MASCRFIRVRCLSLSLSFVLFPVLLPAVSDRDERTRRMGRAPSHFGSGNVSKIAKRAEAPSIHRGEADSARACSQRTSSTDLVCPVIAQIPDELFWPAQFFRSSPAFPARASFQAKLKVPRHRCSCVVNSGAVYALYNCSTTRSERGPAMNVWTSERDKKVRKMTTRGKERRMYSLDGGEKGWV